MSGRVERAAPPPDTMCSRTVSASELSNSGTRCEIIQWSEHGGNRGWLDQRQAPLAHEVGAFCCCSGRRPAARPRSGQRCALAAADRQARSSVLAWMRGSTREPARDKLQSHCLGPACDQTGFAMKCNFGAELDPGKTQILNAAVQQRQLRQSNVKYHSVTNLDAWSCESPPPCHARLFGDAGSCLQDWGCSRLCPNRACQQTFQKV